MKYSEAQTRWYDRETGEIVDAVPLKKPVKIKNENGEVIGERQTTKPTLRHAREFGFLPSTTSVIDILGSYQLEQWKIEQAIKQCIVVPYGEWVVGFERDESGDTPYQYYELSVEAYISTIMAKAVEYAEETADTGKAIHAGVEQFLMDGIIPDDPIILSVCEQIRDHIYKAGNPTLIDCEMSLASTELGYAGTPDIVVEYDDERWSIYDLKTTDLEKFKSPYFKWKLQLGSYYGLVDKKEKTTLIQSVADRNVGTTIFIPYEIPKDLCDAFLSLLNVWIEEREYNPRSTSQNTAE